MWWRFAVVYVQVVVLMGTLGARLGRHGRRWLRDEAGQSTVEYAVLAAVIVLTTMGAIQLFGQGIATVFQNIVTRIQSVS